MTVFSGKANPSADKLRGGYYTPEPIGQFLGDWVTQVGSHFLEPSCGDGAILQFLTGENKEVTAIELLELEAHKAQKRTGTKVDVADFFKWFTRDKFAQFDGVAGNPPYIRFGNWSETSRVSALMIMEDVGLKPNRLTNAWVPFVVGSILATRSGGRVGLVLPAELLQVGYASQLRAFLVENTSEITLVSFEQLVFPGILQEVVLLLATVGDGPSVFRSVELSDAYDLANLKLPRDGIRARLHEDEKWTKYYLQPRDVDLVRGMRTDRRLKRLDTYATVNVGVVTGRNSYFCLTEEQARNLRLYEETVPLVARSALLEGLSYTQEDMARHAADGARTRLLVVEPGRNLGDYPALAEYVEQGAMNGVDQGYKCRIRKDWWAVPSAHLADGFMLRQVSSSLRLSSNEVSATSTDTVHRVFTKPGVQMSNLATVALNSISLAFSEVLGRSYGGGILEMEPSECAELPVPDPSCVPKHIIVAADKMVRSGCIEEAVDLVDREVLIERCGFSAADVRQMRGVWLTMRNRRLARGLRKVKSTVPEIERIVQGRIPARAA
ncbi:MAG: class I SAM-dependent methyltransferase [Cellulomonadaceae bacterium]|jgi:adenine-specific DNA methylase|nr:class I SAM-dependent methyltransferase [Cellulomonadaceae bacterium]